MGAERKLPSNHPYKLGHPLSTGSPSFITDTPFGDGNTIDLADGHVEISSGGNEDVFDGNGSFSVSAWVKGWPDEYPENIASKGYAIPTSKEFKNPELWLDATDTLKPARECQTRRGYINWNRRQQPAFDRGL